MVHVLDVVVVLQHIDELFHVDVYKRQAQEALSQQPSENTSLVTIERDADGAITALTTDTSKLN